MNEPFDEPLTVWRFIRVNAVRIVIGTVLVAMVYGALLVWVPYQREQRIAKEIRAYGGDTVFQYAGPDWIPLFMRGRTTLFSRVILLEFNNNHVTDACLEHLKGLTNLVFLDLHDTHVTDVGVENLKGLTNLKMLDLDETQVTDVGVEHLKGLTNLTNLNLDSTKTTAAGRGMLRKALPNCKIKPDP